jgi:hypothetical protein
MSMHVGLSHSRSVSRASGVRGAAARRALTLCVDADAAAQEAERVMGVDDDRLFSLLEQRDEMISDLAEQIAVLRSQRPTADSALYAATERAVDDADDIIADVCAAVSATQRVTMELAARVARRVAELRGELDEVHRAGNASIGYSAMSAQRVDSRP